MAWKKIGMHEELIISRQIKGNLNPNAVSTYEDSLGNALKKGLLDTTRGTMSVSVLLKNSIHTPVGTDGRGFWIKSV